MKISSHYAPVDMSYTAELKGLTHEGLLRISALAAQIAAEQGEALDLSRVAGPQPAFRRIDA